VASSKIGFDYGKSRQGEISTPTLPTIRSTSSIRMASPMRQQQTGRLLLKTSFKPGIFFAMLGSRFKLVTRLSGPLI
jgi:hypothetical protein